MNLDEIKREREELEADMARREAERKKAETLAWCAERNEPRVYHDYTKNAPPVVTKSAPVPQHGVSVSQPFTAAEMRLLEPLTAAIGEKLAEQRDKMSENQRQMREEMQDFVRREIDKMAQRLRNEALQERLDLERSFRQAEQQRSHRGAGLQVNEMIEINPSDMN